MLFAVSRGVRPGFFSSCRTDKHPVALSIRLRLEHRIGLGEWSERDEDCQRQHQRSRAADAPHPHTPFNPADQPPFAGGFEGCLKSFAVAGELFHPVFFHSCVLLR